MSRFLSMLLGILGASLLEDLLTCQGVKWLKIPGRRMMGAVDGMIRAGERAIRAGQDL